MLGKSSAPGPRGQRGWQTSSTLGTGDFQYCCRRFFEQVAVVVIPCLLALASGFCEYVRSILLKFITPPVFGINEGELGVAYWT